MTRMEVQAGRFFAAALLRMTRMEVQAGRFFVAGLLRMTMKEAPPVMSF